MTLKKLYPVIGIFLLFVLFHNLQFATSAFVGNDAYYHLGMSEIGLDLLDKQFEWTQNSIWTNNFADKEFLFHVFLTPFARLGGLAGAKYATILMDVAVFLCFYLICQRRKFPFPLLWVIFLLGSASTFLYRLSMCRPHVVSLLFTLLLCLGLLQKRKWSVAIICTIFVLSYTAYHLVIGFAVLFTLNHLLHTKKWDSTLLSYALFGTFLGILVHPHFPNNLLIWKIQNFEVLQLNWSSINLGFGAELKPAIGRSFIFNYTLAFMAAPLSLFWIAWKQIKMNEDTTFFLFLSFGFLCLTMMSMRFVEYWPAYAILTAGSMVRDMKLPVSLDNYFDIKYKSKLTREKLRKAQIATSVIIAVGVLFSIKSYKSATTLVRNNPAPYYRNAALWLSENVTHYETVFHADWDDFAQLFYFNRKNYYLCALDPIFMYTHDPDLWLAWKKINRGQSEHPDIVIRERFGARYAFLTKDLRKAIDQFKHHPNMTVEFEDEHCVIFKIHGRSTRT